MIKSATRLALADSILMPLFFRVDYNWNIANDVDDGKQDECRRNNVLDIHGRKFLRLVFGYKVKNLSRDKINLCGKIKSAKMQQTLCVDMELCIKKA